jgi:hypothetical protein
MIQRQVKRREDCWVDPVRATSYLPFALSFGISPDLGSQRTRTYPGLADALEAIALCVGGWEGYTGGTRENGAAQAHAFQSVRLVGAVGIERYVISQKPRKQRRCSRSC